MSDLMILGGGPLTMSSYEIAELLQTRHDSVKRSIERCVNRGAITPPPLVEVQNPGPGPLTMEVYSLGKRDSLVVVAQLSPEFTAAVVDRWQELESSQATALPNFASPADAARAWAIEYEEKQKAQQALALAAPKVKFFDRVAERGTLMNATQVAQKLGMSALAMNKVLEELGVYSRNIKRARVFKQWFIDQGYGELKQTECGHSQPLFTTTGQAWVVERFTSEGIAA